ncbi:MAG: LacI family DNA-binding transcriptional regulator [Treponema sp.]|nr:LacI family DNA-binding transcriptional regulator [Treponema sp.]
MAKKTTIYTIAEQLGVSSTTVYRALNGKPRVSEETRNAVLKAAKDLDFKANTLAKTLARKPLRIAVLITSGFPEFHRHVIRGVKQTEAELRDYNTIVDYFSFDGGDNQEEEERFFTDSLRRIASGPYEGLLVQGMEAEEFQLLAKKNIPIAVVVTDIVNSGRRFCIQHNGITAGHIAAELLYWRLGQNAKVALATGLPDVQIHQQTVQGFLDQTVITPLDMAAVIYNHDNEALAYMNTKELLREHPDIRGMYVNTYNSEGVIRGIREQGLAGKICLITSDLNDHLKKCLEEGTVSATIFQNQYRQGRLGLRYLYRHIAENLEVEDAIRINPEVIFRSNMALYD